MSSRQDKGKSLLSLVKLVMDLGPSVSHGGQILIILFQADSGIPKLDI